MLTFPISIRSDSAQALTTATLIVRRLEVRFYRNVGEGLFMKVNAALLATDSLRSLFAFVFGILFLAGAVISGARLLIWATLEKNKELHGQSTLWWFLILGLILGFSFLEWAEKG